MGPLMRTYFGIVLLIAAIAIAYATCHQPIGGY